MARFDSTCVNGHYLPADVAACPICGKGSAPENPPLAKQPAPLKLPPRRSEEVLRNIAPPGRFTYPREAKRPTSAPPQSLTPLALLLIGVLIAIIFGYNLFHHETITAPGPGVSNLTWHCLSPWDRMAANYPSAQQVQQEILRDGVIFVAMGNADCSQQIARQDHTVWLTLMADAALFGGIEIWRRRGLAA